MNPLHCIQLSQHGYLYVVICCSYRCWYTLSVCVSCELRWRVDVTTLFLVMLLSCPCVQSAPIQILTMTIQNGRLICY
jgi:hypothetical protein